MVEDTAPCSEHTCSFHSRTPFGEAALILIYVAKIQYQNVGTIYHFHRFRVDLRTFL